MKFLAFVIALYNAEINGEIVLKKLSLPLSSFVLL